MKKKLLIGTIGVTLLLINVKVNAQAFEKGNVNIDVGLGLGIYKTTTEITVDLPFFGVFTLVEDDGASSFMVPLNFEYGISDKFGIGFQLGFSNYFIDNKDSTETTESVKSSDFAIKFNYHFLNSDKNDLFVGIAFGGSRVNWLDLSGEELNGSGSYFSLYLTDRIFFGEHIGILFNLGYTGYRYSNITSSVNNGFISSLKWDLAGVNLGTGLAIKF